MLLRRKSPEISHTFSRNQCLKLLQSSPSLSRIKETHCRALRFGVPISSADLGKHLILAVVALSVPLLSYAERIFRCISRPSVFTYNTMIRLFAESENPGPVVSLFPQMLAAGLWPDTHTYPFLLKACAKLLHARHGETIHCRSVKDGQIEGSVFVQNSMLHLYAACGRFECAYKLFDAMPKRNLITWNTIINGFALNGRANEALTLYKEMTESGDEPDGFTMVSPLSACGELGALVLGRRVHLFILKIGLIMNSHVGNSLIDLYSKCGDISSARKMFDEMSERRTAVSWTTLVTGLAVNGFGEESLALFRGMEKAKLTPTEITFVGVLYACSHCGLVDEGFSFFHQMTSDYGIVPKIEHFGCMVDLLGRSGMVDRAYAFIRCMPQPPNAVIWRTLLGACAMHKRVDIGEIAWSHLELLDPGHSGDFVLLSNLYACGKRWADVQKMREKMLRGGVRKTPGKTLLELGNMVHEFVVGDREHPENDAIYEMLEEIAMKLRKEGYVAGTMGVLADIEEEEKETVLNYHSERLAIAYAILKTAPRTPIRIVKNLRVCMDCHLATKLVSKVYEREIIVRDRSRFHHFSGGLCSCKDYW